MKLNELKNLLGANRDKAVQMQLPDGTMVPESFHVTEVGQVDKKFIDCGGKIHSTQSCQLQIWLGPDTEHRVSSGKFVDILHLGDAVLGSDEIDVEIEYESAQISQFPLQSVTVGADAVTLNFSTKHTDCLAKELCLLPTTSGDCSCGPTGCC